jgi:L-alanine-DL-glutamate epimerase-like enolase superfamily enzyme
MPRIVAVDTFPVNVPLIRPFMMSNVRMTTSPNVLVRVRSDDGTIGWGEGVSALPVTGESQARILATVEDLKHRIIGRDALDRSGAWLALQEHVKSNRTGIGAIDIALHDLAGRILGVPVSTLIGGRGFESTPVIALFGSGDPEADLTSYEEKYAAGYRWFKLKVGISTPERESRTLAIIAERPYEDIVLAADANGAWDEHTARMFIRRIADLPIRFFEQPVDDRGAMMRLARSSPVALCADEHADALETIMSYSGSGLAGVSLKLVKLGGISGVMRGAAICRAAGMAINLAGKIAETSIAAAANLHCAAAINELRYGCSPGNQVISRDVTAEPLKVGGGSMLIPDGPGLGIEVDEDLVRSMAP